MPYNIRTRDGITLKNIPDDWQPDDDRLKQAVAQRRAQLQQNAPPESAGDRLKRTNPGEYDTASPEYQAKYGATSGMSGGQKAWANLGAGFKNFGIGAAQLALPKSLEQDVGITDESIDEKRGRDDTLAHSMKGGKLLQIAGEALPTLAVPGGAVSGAALKAGRFGAGLAKVGVGTRWLPTAMAEGAGLGGVAGAITPTKSDESSVANAAMGAAGGALVPAALGGLGYLARPFIPALRRRAVAGKLAEEMPVDDAAQKALSAKIRASNQRVVDAPQTTAEVTQNPDFAKMELAARANPETNSAFAHLSETQDNARWKVLDEALGNQASVDSAKATTDAYVRDALPTVMKAMKPTTLSEGIRDLMVASKQKLDAASANRHVWSETVFNKLREEIKASNRSPQALWNVRKMLREWQEGRPPPGMEATRAPKGDPAINEAVGAIDATLNRASGNRWKTFLSTYGEHAKKEAAQRAGQNIRNMFMDETTGAINGPITAAKNPIPTRAKLTQALQTHGQNDFGETLDYAQRNVVDQVLDDLHSSEVLNRAKKVMTGGGGSQTTPLRALLQSQSHTAVNSRFYIDLAKAMSNYSRKKQQVLLNQILLNPDDALLLMRQAQKISRPLDNKERTLLQGVRAIISSPAYTVNGAKQGESDQASQ